MRRSLATWQLVNGELFMHFHGGSSWEALHKYSKHAMAMTKSCGTISKHILATPGMNVLIALPNLLPSIHSKRKAANFGKPGPTTRANFVHSSGFGIRSSWSGETHEYHDDTMATWFALFLSLLYHHVNKRHHTAVRKPHSPVKWSSYLPQPMWWLWIKAPRPHQSRAKFFCCSNFILRNAPSGESRKQDTSISFAWTTCTTTSMGMQLILEVKMEFSFGFPSFYQLMTRAMSLTSNTFELLPLPRISWLSNSKSKDGPLVSSLVEHLILDDPGMKFMKQSAFGPTSNP